MELEKVELTVEEIKLVEAYRQLSPADRELSLVILNRLNAAARRSMYYLEIFNTARIIISKSITPIISNPQEANKKSRPKAGK